jgi:cellulose synthase/poly-beta-1,6-N-acetylglucosamine synthase-like glycosyltransferase
MADLADELEQDGWRVHRVARATPTPPELTLRALYRVETTYVVRLDGDSWLADDVGCAVAAAARVRADLCSVKVLPSKRESIAERLQGVEYDCAMLNRRIRPWLTSGACMIARTDALRFLLYRHSRWFCGEDIETGVLAKRYRMNVQHIETEVFTEVPPSFRALWHQRALWWAGSFRQTWINFEHGLRTPLSLLYSAWLVWLMFVAKALTISAALKLLPPMIVLYTCILITANWSVKSRWMVLYPYYALVQSLLLPIAGIYSYVRLARHQRDLGRYRIGLRRSKTWLAR